MTAVRQSFSNVSRGVASCFSRPVAGLLTRSYGRGVDRERYNYIFNASAPQPKLAALDKDFREKAFHLVTGDKPFNEFSPEEIATADAFVSYDEEFREKAELLRQSKKPIEAFSPEEKRVMELYVNFDKEFGEVVKEVMWRDYPTDDVDEIRTLYVNFHTKFKEQVDSLTRGLYYADSRKHDEREHFLCVNYHRGFQEKAQALINGTKEFDQMDFGEQTTLKNYINLHEKFKEQARALINGFKTVESLSDEEKRIIQLFVRHNLKFREDIINGAASPAFNMVSQQHIRSYNYALLFDTEFREKTQRLIKRRFRDLLPGEQKVVRAYVNFSESFKSAVAFKKDTFGNSFHRIGASYSLRFSRKELRSHENYTACNEKYLHEVKKLIFGDKNIADFTNQEDGMVQLYVHHNEEFQKQVNVLFTKSFLQLSTTEKRIFSLNYKYEERFKRRVDDLIESIKDPELLTPEERTLAVLYVNCDSGFQKKVAKLISTKKEYSVFNLEEERIATLYTNFDINFQVEVRALIGEHHKKGGFYDIDQKLHYPPMDLSLWRSYNYAVSIGGGMRPTVEPFDVESSAEPEIKVPPPQPASMIDFTPQEEVKIKLYVHFHTDYRASINQLLRRELPRTNEAKRIFHLGMWYDHDLRENVFSNIWDKASAQKIIDGTSKDMFMSKEQVFDAALTKKPHTTDEDWAYWALGFDYYQIRLKPF